MDKKINVRKKLDGVVVSKNADNKVKVRVERKMTHPVYGKIVKSHKNYLVVDADNKAEIGDKVTIEEGRPVSKKVYFYIVNIVGKKQ